MSETHLGRILTIVSPDVLLGCGSSTLTPQRPLGKRLTRPIYAATRRVVPLFVYDLDVLVIPIGFGEANKVNVDIRSAQHRAATHVWPFISVKVLYTAAILEIKMTRLTLDLPGVRRVLS